MSQTHRRIKLVILQIVHFRITFPFTLLNITLKTYFWPTYYNLSTINMEKYARHRQLVTWTAV
jgi:hypothetical protein